MKAAKPSSETAYLQARAAQARAAFRQTLGDVTSGVGTGVSPAQWAKTHPWLTLSSATLAGFVAACIAVPSKQQAALRRLARIERALQPETSDKPHESNGDRKAKRGLFSLLAVELVRSGATIASSIIRGMTAPPAAPTPPAPPPPPGTSG